MERSMQCCIFVLWVAHSSLASAADANLGDARLAPIDDPYSIRFQAGSAGVTKEKISEAIRLVGTSRGWAVANEADGRTELNLLVRGQHEATVRVEYDASGYSVRYVKSVNLLYREQIGQGISLRAIHRNYNGWLKGLVTGVNRSIGAPAEVVVGFAPLGDAEAVPYLEKRGREAYKEFTTLPAPRAFAIAPNGAWGRDSYKNVSPSFRRDVVGNALDSCNRRGNRECRLYAIDDHVVWPKTVPARSAAKAGDSQPLAGEGLVKHVALLRQIQANTDSRLAFTFSVSSEGRTERVCQTCPVEVGAGTMSTKAEEGLVCFQWEKITYPDSGCFKVVPTGRSAFVMRGTKGERSIKYSLAP